MRYLKTIFAAVLFLVSAAPSLAFQQDDVQELLKKMRHAGRNNAFRAEAQVERSARERHISYTLKMVNRPPERISREYILTPEQEKRRNEMRQRRGRQSHDDPPRGRRMQGRPEPGQLNINDLNLLEKNYDVMVNNGGEIAGRSAVRIEIMPKIARRPLNRFWLDRETGVVLKRELFDNGTENGPMFRETIVSIEYEEFDRQEAERLRKERRQEWQDKRKSRRNIETEEYEELDELPDDLHDKLISPGSIPPGFELENLRVFRERGSVVFHQVYSDGLLKFSLFQLPAGGSADKRFTQRNSRQMRLMIKQDDDTRYILAGYLPRHIMRPIFESLPGREEHRRR